MPAATAPKVQGVHFVGSAPCPDVAATFQTCVVPLRDRLRRVPDGEPGERGNWIWFQRDLFNKYPKILAPYDASGPQPGEPATDDEIKAALDDLAPLHTSYDTHAIESYRAFRAARDKGDIASTARFMVALPTVLAFVGPMIAQAWRSAVEPLYQDAMMRAMDRIQAEIPHQDLSIQFDFCVELNVLDAQQVKTWYDDVYEGTFGRVERLVRAVEPDVELGFHFCYGDFQHKHWKEPDDLKWVNQCAMELKRRVKRPIAWMHMPVPKDRDDAAYFAPLAELVQNRGDTEIYLGLIHPDDEAGTRRRIEAAGHTVPVFGVATECGMGRVPTHELASILHTCADVTEPW